MSMTIGELAAAAGVNPQTVRYYERRAILAEPPRTASGYRVYAPEALDRLRFIKRAQELGFSLDEIAEFLDLRVEDPASCAIVDARTQAKLEDVRRKIRELRRMERVLEKLAADCAVREPTEECPILDALIMRRAWLAGAGFLSGPRPPASQRPTIRGERNEAGDAL